MATLALWLPAGSQAAAQALPDALAAEPRAFGYSVGDVIERTVRLDLPAGSALDRSSLPEVGGRGKALELRSVMLKGDALTLRYQVFLAPREVRTLEMPPLSLRITGGPRVVDLRVDAWPVTVAPLVPVEVSPRRGLGEMRPDAVPPSIDTSAAQRRLAVYGLLALLPALWLAHVYIGLPWWTRRRRPFGLAWQALSAMPASPTAAQRQAAWQRVHAALNHTAGEVVFAPGLETFLAANPAFARLRGELQQFFERSRTQFFSAGSNGAASDDSEWLRGFCGRCRDVERGAA